MMHKNHVTRLLPVILILMLMLAGCQRGQVNEVEEADSQQRATAITATSSAALPPEQVVVAFYEWYLDEMGETRDDEMNQLLSDRGYRGHPLLTQAFSAKVDSILDHYQEAGSRDPFLCGFEAPDAISALADNEDGVNAGVDLLLGDTGVTLRIALIRQDGGWRISDVSCP